MSDETIFFVGENEDGGFIRKVDSVSELEEYIAPYTDGEYDELQLDSLERKTDSIWFDTEVYVSSDRMTTFSVIKGEEVELVEEEVITKLSLEEK